MQKRFYSVGSNGPESKWILSSFCVFFCAGANMENRILNKWTPWEHLFSLPIDPIMTILHTIRYVIQNFPIRVECWLALSNHRSKKCQLILFYVCLLRLQLAFYYLAWFRSYNSFVNFSCLMCSKPVCVCSRCTLVFLFYFSAYALSQMKRRHQKEETDI